MLKILLLLYTVGVAVAKPPPSPKYQGLLGSPRLPSRSPRTHEGRAPVTVDELISAARNQPPQPNVRRKMKKDDGSVLVEMDIKMKKDRYQRTYQGDGGKTPRKGLVDEAYRWTNNTIPYAIDSFFNDWERKAIRAGMDEWEKYTCMKMKPRTTETDYINIISADGCWSWVGMEKGMQELSLNVYGCIYHHTIVHELGHAVGFHHEQTRPDRDDWVKIHVENITPGQEYNFEKYKSDYVGDFGVKYDYWSVMHYGQYAFTARGGKTITTKNEDYQEVIGTVPGLSFKDIQAANIMYKCDSHCTKQCPAKAIRSKDCKCWCNTGNPGGPVEEWDGVSVCKGGNDYNETCIDYHSQCQEWANSGECTANPNFMLVSCRRACKVCGPDAVCQDFNDNCPYWAMIGECQANPGWMNTNCPKSCKICGDPGPEPGDCEDRWDLCASAAKNGDCETYATSMLWECPVSCQACGDNAICRNWDILCNTWEEMGECEKNPDWMKRVCARACKQCQGEDVPDCKNYVRDSDCEAWAGTGECVLNPGWMLYKCAKSCRVCGDKAECLDRDPNCHYWKGNGLCETDKPGMNFYCPLSCGLCKGDPDDTVDCKNYDFSCERWEAMGECDANPSFMLYYCPRECRACGPNPVCKNYHPTCEQWAKEGECTANPGYMELHCKKACGLCNGVGTTGGSTSKLSTTTSGPRPTDPPVDGECDPVLPGDQCRDDPDYILSCPDYVVSGMCDKDPSEMYRFCPKSCQMCGKNALCKDYNDMCAMWAATNQCLANPGYMHIFCRKSCECCTER